MCAFFMSLVMFLSLYTVCMFYICFIYSSMAVALAGSTQQRSLTIHVHPAVIQTQQQGCIWFHNTCYDSVEYTVHCNQYF